ncbi:hypothetical protein B0A53_05576 [Rhodotorula sp. CCFEE 5036]|nr:hypothetical protein B0A53_05576 [Rhodotorula sp. CCFEE 5036]
MGVHPTTVARWLDCFESTGSLKPKPIRGRPRKATMTQQAQIQEALEARPDVFGREIAESLRLDAEPDDLQLSLRSVYAEMKRLGFTHKRMQWVSDERDEAARQDFVDYISDGGFTPDQLVYAAAARSGNRGKKFSMVAALGVDRMLVTRTVEGAFNSLSFYDFVTDDLSPFLEPYPGKNSVIVMDNCSIHKSALLSSTLQALGVLLVFIPARCPEFNAIEGAFGWTKRMLAAEADLFAEFEPGEAIGSE